MSAPNASRLEPVFQKARETGRRKASLAYQLPDVIKAALAMFVFKMPSLLVFERAGREGKTMRQRLDGIDVDSLLKSFKVLFAQSLRAPNECPIAHFSVQGRGVLPSLSCRPAGRNGKKDQLRANQCSLEITARQHTRN